jgi:hypothetical protein
MSRHDNCYYFHFSKRLKTFSPSSHLAADVLK